MEIFGKRLKDSIIAKEYEQKDIARMLKVSKATVTHWTNGRMYPTVEKLIKLCILLDESADYLLGLKY